MGCMALQAVNSSSIVLRTGETATANGEEREHELPRELGCTSRERVEFIYLFCLLDIDTGEIVTTVKSKQQTRK